MKKIRLDPDTLRVETFAAVAAAERGAGTVHAHGPSLNTGCQTCDPLCEMTSVESCPDTYCCPSGLMTCEAPETSLC